MRQILLAALKTSANLVIDSRYDAGSYNIDSALLFPESSTPAILTAWTLGAIRLYTQDSHHRQPQWTCFQIAHLNGAVHSTFLDLNKDIKVEISGHTDNTGSAISKEELSLRRAESVRDYMLKAGVTGRNMQVAGYGMARPVGDNATEEGRAANRRVEVEVVEIFRR